MSKNEQLSLAETKLLILQSISLESRINDSRISEDLRINLHKIRVCLDELEKSEFIKQRIGGNYGMMGKEEHHDIRLTSRGNLALAGDIELESATKSSSVYNFHAPVGSVSNQGYESNVAGINKGSQNISTQQNIATKSTLNNNRFTGQWAGAINGTNQGNIFLDFTQDENTITGTISINDPQFGVYDFQANGWANGEKASVKIYPNSSSSNLGLGSGEVNAILQFNGTLEGNWKTDIGTAGTFSAKMASKKTGATLIIHGHAEQHRYQLRDFLQNSLSLPTPIVMGDAMTPGLTLPQKFESLASKVEFAVALLTPDDKGKATSETKYQSRARQNVLIEIGWFWGQLGLDKVLLLVKDKVEIPSDLQGLEYYKFNNSPVETSEKIRAFYKSHNVTL